MCNTLSAGVGFWILGVGRSVPFMVLGIDVYCTFDGQRWLGLVATLDRPCSQHFSMAALLDQQEGRPPHEHGTNGT